MVEAYHITKVENRESILMKGIVPGIKLITNNLDDRRGLAGRIRNCSYDTFYGFYPVFITFNPVEAISTMGYRGSVDEWCVAIIDATNLNVKQGLFPWESVTNYIPSECIRRFEPLSNFL
jgi:hypothetical protein